MCKNCKIEGEFAISLYNAQGWLVLSYVVVADERIGHRTLECTENRKFDLNNIPDKLPEEAWAALKKASDQKDLEEFREVSQL